MAAQGRGREGGDSLIGIAASVAVAAADWVAVGRGPRRLEGVLKPLVPVPLIAVAAAVHSWWFAAALALCLAGDVLLLPQVDRFRSGLSAFLLAHIAFIAGFQAFPIFRPGLGFIPIILLLLVWPAVRILRAAPEALRLPVSAYVLVLGAMLAVAVSRGNGFLEGGALLFVFSDCLLAWNRFVQPVPGGRLVVMVTYHLAIILLTLSLLL